MSNTTKLTLLNLLLQDVMTGNPNSTLSIMTKPQFLDSLLQEVTVGAMYVMYERLRVFLLIDTDKEHFVDKGISSF